MKFIVEISARHVHLSQKSLEILFGKGYQLTPRRFLSQPGQFVSNERVEIVGPRNSIKGVSVLGPLREKTQVELSMTDARKVGIDTSIRESGDLSGTSGCKIIGPNGEYDLKEGVIVAKRHIHMTPKDADEFGVKDGQIVSVKVNVPDRPVVFGNVVVRVREKFSLACHIDTDEANSAGLKEEFFGKLILENIF